MPQMVIYVGVFEINPEFSADKVMPNAPSLRCSSSFTELGRCRNLTSSQPWPQHFTDLTSSFSQLFQIWANAVCSHFHLLRDQ